MSTPPTAWPIWLEEQDQLLAENAGQGQFHDVGPQRGEYFREKRSARGAAVWDYDNDGDLDIIVSHVDLRGTATLLRNDGGNRQHWVGLTLSRHTSSHRGRGAGHRPGRGSDTGRCEPTGKRLLVLSRPAHALRTGTAHAYRSTRSALVGRARGRLPRSSRRSLRDDRAGRKVCGRSRSRPLAESTYTVSGTTKGARYHRVNSELACSSLTNFSVAGSNWSVLYSSS